MICDLTESVSVSENKRIAYPMDSVDDYYTPQKRQPTALPELQNRASSVIRAKSC